MKHFKVHALVVILFFVFGLFQVVALESAWAESKDQGTAVSFDEFFKRWKQENAKANITGDFERGLEAAEAGNFDLAYEIWLKESQSGHVLAQSYLGILYAQGQGVTQDGAEAAKWFRMAAEQGDVKAQTNLGSLYAKGFGVPKDDQEAAKWYRIAAAQGDTNAKSYLGVMYARGLGVEQNDREAAKWFQMAAREGDVKAQYGLAVMYDVGRGVQQNKVVAYAWYALAAEQGDVTSQEVMQSIQSNLTPEEIAMSAQIAEQLRSH